MVSYKIAAGFEVYHIFDFCGVKQNGKILYLFINTTGIYRMMITKASN